MMGRRVLTMLQERQVSIMHIKSISLFILTTLLFGACAPGAEATPALDAAPTVVADSTIIAEGQLEPGRFGQIAFTASGRISKILVQEGQTVRQGEELIRLGDASDPQYAAAQLELVSARKALTDLNNTSGTDLAQAVIDLKDAREEYN